MMLQTQNYDHYQQYDIHKTMKFEQNQIKQMKQDLIRNSLYEQKQLQEEIKRRDEEQKYKYEQDEVKQIQSINQQEKDFRQQQKQQTIETLSKKYSEIINQKQNIQNQKKNDDLNVETQMINLAQQALEMEKQNQIKKKQFQKMIYNEQMKMIEEKKLQEKQNKNFERIIYQDQAIKDQQRILQQEENYRQYFKQRAARNEKLQDLYRKNVDDPKSSLDYIINKQIQEKQLKEQQEIETKRQYDKNIKSQYINTLTNQIKEKEEKKQDYDYMRDSRQPAISFQEQEQQYHKNKYESKSQIHDELSNLVNTSQKVQDKTSENLSLSAISPYNPLTNPNPNQIQNPYILKQLKNGTLNYVSSPQSKLAHLGQSSLIK